MPSELQQQPVAPAQWERRLTETLGVPVEVRYGRARTQVVRAGFDGPRGVWVVRLNAMFADAPEEVQEALARWMRAGRRARRASELLDGWIEDRLQRLHREEPRRVKLQTRGSVHDLERLAGELFESEFVQEYPGGEGAPSLTWGRAARSRSRRSLRLGSYDYSSRLVRVHRVLDQSGIPDWFVRYVLFHELLHSVLDEPSPGGRRVLHGPRFRQRERAYRDYGRACAWESIHIDALIRSARRGVSGS